MRFITGQPLSTSVGQKVGRLPFVHALKTIRQAEMGDAHNRQIITAVNRALIQ